MLLIDNGYRLLLIIICIMYIYIMSVGNLVYYVFKKLRYLEYMLINLIE